MLKHNWQMNYAVRLTMNLRNIALFVHTNSYKSQIIFLLFTEKYESPGMDDNSSIDEMEEEQGQEELEKMDFDDNFAAEENVNEEMDSEFVDGEEAVDEEINEMDEQITSDIQNHGPELHKTSFTMSKKKSETSLLSLPIQKRCVFVKLANQFNYKNRFTQTKKCILRVSKLSYNYCIQGVLPCYTDPSRTVNITFFFRFFFSVNFL